MIDAMRGIGTVLVSVAVLGGCLGSRSTQCANGVVCPEGLVCVSVNPFCVSPDEASACVGVAERDTCAFPLGDQTIEGVCIEGVCQECNFDIAGCDFLTWVPMTSGVSVPLNDVWFVGPHDAYVVGDDTTLRHYDGFTWSPVESWEQYRTAMGVDRPLTAVWASDSEHIVIVAGSRIYYQVNGSWNEYMPVRPMAEVWGSSAENVYVVGASDQILHFDGTTWTEMPTGQGLVSLNGIWGSGANNVFAVGNNGLILHYTGTSWALRTSNTLDDLYAIAGIGPDDAFAVGENNIVLRYQNASWGLVPMDESIPNWMKIRPAVSELVDVWVASSSDTFIARGDGQLLHFDNEGSWSVMLTPTASPTPTSALAGISGSTPDEVFTVGATGTIWRYTGASWCAVPISGASTTVFNDVAAPGPDVVHAIGDGMSVRYDESIATGWETTNSGTIQVLHGVSANGTKTFAVGELGTIVEYTTSWSSVSSSSTQVLNDVVSIGSDFLAAGVRVVLHYSSSTNSWTGLIDDPSRTITGVWGSSPDDFFTVDAQGVQHRSEPLVEDSDASVALEAIWGSSANDVVAVGPSGAIVRFDGTDWKTFEPIVDSRLMDVWGTAADDVFAVGTDTTVLHFDGRSWKRLPPPPDTSANLNAVTGARRAVYVVGSNGTILKLIRSAR